jgi:hypothetical protein
LLLNHGIFCCETQGNIKKPAFLQLAKTNEFVKIRKDCMVIILFFSLSPPDIGVAWYHLLAGTVNNCCSQNPIHSQRWNKTIAFVKVQSILNHEKILGNLMPFGLRNMKLFVRIGTRLRD